MVKPRIQGEWDKEIRKQTMVNTENERQTKPTQVRQTKEQKWENVPGR